MRIRKGTGLKGELMKKWIVPFVIGASIFATGCKHNPTVLGQKIDRNIFCPAAGKFCSQTIGTVPTITLTREARFLSTNEAGEPSYWDFLGREYTESGSMIVNFCGNEAVNPLRTYANAQNVDLIVDDVASNSVTFKRKVSSRTDLSSNIDLVAILNFAGVPTGTAHVEAQAAMAAALTRLKDREVDMRGRYSFVYISPSTLALLKANTVPDELDACSDALRTGSAPIIASLTLARIDTLTTSGNFSSNATGSLDASLANILTGAQLAAVKAGFEKAIEETYETAFAPTYQVLSIGGYDGT